MVTGVGIEPTHRGFHARALPAELSGHILNGQESGLRSRGLVQPEHALCLAELPPDENIPGINGNSDGFLCNRS